MAEGRVEPFESRMESSRELFCIHLGYFGFISTTNPVRCESGLFLLHNFGFSAVLSARSIKVSIQR